MLFSSQIFMCLLDKDTAGGSFLFDFNISFLNEKKQKRRNMGIAAHVDAGKTTTTEMILYLAGENHKLGKVDSGNTTTDWMPQEKERGITITSAAVNCQWVGNRITLIDTPGHVDFTIEVGRSLRVLDGVVAVFDAVSGVEPQSEIVWRQAHMYGVPRICFINKMDRTGSNFNRCVKMINERLGAKPVVISTPYFKNGEFKGCIDLIAMNQIIWHDNDNDDCNNFYISDIDDDLKAESQKRRMQMIEDIVSVDDECSMTYLETEDLPNDKIVHCLRVGTINMSFFPVLCGSAFKKKCVQNLLDAIVYYLPSPEDIKEIKGFDYLTGQEIRIPCSDNGDLAALVFKIMTDPFVGTISFIRIYSGILRCGDEFFISTKGTKARVGRMLLMQSNDKKEIKEARSGDIVALTGVKFSTGDTICSMNSKFLLEKINVPEPVIALSIEPKSNAMQDKMSVSLNKILNEDPSLKVEFNKETGQTILNGMGELHLEIVVDRLKREFGVDVVVGAPHVAYKETITDESLVRYIHKQQTGGAGQFADVVIRFSPINVEGSAQIDEKDYFIFENALKGDNVPGEYVPGVKKGIEYAMRCGLNTHFPVIGVKAVIEDGSSHSVDSSVFSFEMAARGAFRELKNRKLSCVLEPIMKIEIIFPEEYIGDVIGDFNKKRGIVQDIESSDNLQIIKGQVPLASMFGYVSALRSMTQGRGQYSMSFEKYSRLPERLAEEIKKNN